jgi:hypothetical protein
MLALWNCHETGALKELQSRVFEIVRLCEVEWGGRQSICDPKVIGKGVIDRRINSKMTEDHLEQPGLNEKEGKSAMREES